MAPKPAGRRRSKGREPEQPTNRINLINFQKPNLPPLQGTPSSRRQYAYGSGVEPLPARPGRQGHPNDLGAAVHGALNRRQQSHSDDDNEESEEEESENESTPNEDTEDELSRSEVDYRPAPPLAKQEPGKRGPQTISVTESLTPALNHRGWTPEGSEFDDVRSFDMENNYYGDATIESLPQPSLNSNPASVTRSPFRKRLASKSLEPNGVKPLQIASRLASTIPPAKDPGHLHLPLATDTAPASQQPLHYDQPEEDKGLGRQGRADELMPPPPKRSWNPVKNFFSSKSLAPVSPPDSEARSSLEAGGVNIISQSSGVIDNSRPVEPSISKSVVDDQVENDAPSSRGWLSITPGSIRKNFLARNKRTVATPDLDEPSPGPSPQYRSDHSEMDAAMQRNIEEAEEKSIRQMQREREAEAQQEMWRQRWAWLPSFRSTIRSQSPESEEDMTDEDDEDLMNLWQLFNPLTYLRAILWFFGSILDQFSISVPNVFTTSVERRLARLGETLAYLIGGTLTLLLALVLARVAYTNLPDDLLYLDGVSWPQFQDVTSRIRELIPPIPWSSRGAWDDFPEFGSLKEADYAEFEDLINNVLRELRLIKDGGQLHDESIKKLEFIVPKLVHMKVQDGKPAITEEFWHAIRDRIRDDDGFLSFNKKSNGYQLSHEDQWKSMVARLTNDPAFASQLNLSVDKMEKSLAKKMPYFWDAWVNNNQRKVAELLGSALDKSQLSGSPANFDKRLEEMVKKQLSSNTKAGGTIVTRDEFLRHLKNEFAAHRSEMKAEINELQPKIEKLVRESVDLARNDSPAGMSRLEVTKLVDKVVRKAIADANLEAMANGRIHSYWDKDLKNQVNYFGIGAGAIVDPKHSSKTFEPDKKYIEDHGLKGLMRYNPIEALLPWHDNGDCWCAARGKNHRGNPHGAMLAVIMGHTVIPQHIVIEHILPGATTNPGARPRHIEVYASIEDKVVRERILDFGAAHFPDDESDWNFTPPDLAERFVKISQFIYEGAELHDGIHVHRLSSELMAMNAETDQVIIRAVSNYGASSHTCFYRVRLFGHRTDQSNES